MLRFYKFYQFEISDKNNYTISFSAYPGSVISTDDFYLIKDKLVITETTLSIDDEFSNLYNDIDYSNYIIPDFIRIGVSNMLSKNGEDWVNFM